MFKNKNEENSILLFSVPEEKKNILNDKLSSITESSIDYIPNKRKKISEEDNFYSLSMKEPKLSKQKKITFNIKPEIIKKEEKINNEKLLFSVPKEKMGELNYKSSLTTEPIFGFKNEEKKNNEKLFSVPKEKMKELNYKSSLTTEPIFGFKKEEKKIMKIYFLFQKIKKKIFHQQ